MAMTTEKSRRFPKAVNQIFTWLPPHARMSRFGGPVSPRPAETRRPELWLARDGNELYLVNERDETLSRVVVDKGGFQTVDDDVLTVSSASLLTYENVQPGEAVKVDEYDGFYDLDYVLYVHLEIESPLLGRIAITSPGEKGGVGEVVLLWNSGEPGKCVHIKRRDDREGGGIHSPQSDQ